MNDFDKIKLKIQRCLLLKEVMVFERTNPVCKWMKRFNICKNQLCTCPP